jgi:glucose-6-phosphate isomerase
MIGLKVNTGNIAGFVEKEEIRLFESELSLHRENIYQKTGKGSDFLGWVNLPSEFEEGLLSRINEDATRIREQSDYVVVTGIGGSYLGTRAVTEALGHPFSNLQNKAERNAPLLLYAGHHLDAEYLNQLLEFLNNKEYSVIVISKSGTTTEPAVAFRLLKNHLENKYGKKEASRRIYAVTDAARGALKQVADNEGYSSYVIPDDVGGRYSVLTPVGLLPIAAAGFDISRMIDGAAKMETFLRQEEDIFKNPAALYAIVRNLLYRKGKTIEILAGYTPSLFYFIEWWKQLYGESEGKDQKGIFPAGVGFTTDLHSMGQYIQEGLRNIFETVIKIDKPRGDLEIPADSDNLDGLNFLAGQRLSHVNQMAATGTMIAHVDGGVPNIEIEIPGMSETSLGELIYFFEMACALSGYMLDVNPFDQPGVEAYKKNMFALLNKPGFEKETSAIRKRLNQTGSSS